MAVNDIRKLRPELLEKSIAELERQQAELTMAIEEKQREVEVAAKEALATEANKHIDAVLTGIKFLHDNSILPERLVTALSRGDGQFNPGTFLRAVTAENLVARTAGRSVASGDKPKRTRRTKAEMEAARAAGEVRRRR